MKFRLLQEVRHDEKSRSARRFLRFAAKLKLIRSFHAEPARTLVITNRLDEARSAHHRRSQVSDSCDRQAAGF